MKKKGFTGWGCFTQKNLFEICEKDYKIYEMAEKEYGITISEALRDREIVLARPFSLLDEQKFQ